jgi:UDP-glucose 4-epimerase
MALYLVTGGCGFIGSHLVDALVDAGHRVRILDDLSSGRRENAPARAELIVGDVADQRSVATAMAHADGCFHLAAVASVERCTKDWAGSHRVNLDGTIHVFDAAREARGGTAVPVVYASSAAVYGDNSDIPLAEDATKSPLSAYGADKLGCELHGRVAAHVYGVPNTGLRFFNVYGPRQDPNSPYSGVITIFANRLLAGEALTIQGDGKQVRDFIHVSDVVRALTAAMATLAAGPRAVADTFNVCTGTPTDINSLAALMGELGGRPPRLIYAAPRPGDTRFSVGNGERAAQALGVRPQTTLKDGLAATFKRLDAQLGGRGLSPGAE